jgi:hypothetical protein
VTTLVFADIAIVLGIVGRTQKEKTSKDKALKVD